MWIWHSSDLKKIITYVPTDIWSEKRCNEIFDFFYFENKICKKCFENMM